MTRSIVALDGVGIIVDVAVGTVRVGVSVNINICLIVGAIVPVEGIAFGNAVSLGKIKSAFALNVGVAATPQMFGAGLQLIKMKIKNKTKKRFRSISPNLLRIVTTKVHKGFSFVTLCLLCGLGFLYQTFKQN